MASEVVVVGAGVIGLTTAVRLAEAGHGVVVLSDQEPGSTTSAAAGAMLGISGMPPDHPATRWTEVATAVFDELARDPTTGIHRVHGRIVTDFADEAPPWARSLPDFRACTAEERRGFRSGMMVTLPFADMPVYLQYLQRRLTAGGGRLEIERVEDLADLAREGRVLVNATGTGARELCGDTGLTGVRGVHVVVRNTGVDQFRMEAVATPVWTNVFPHGDHVVVGGIAVPDGADGPSDDEAAAAILARAVEVEPRLAGATVLGRQVGRRPVRAVPRTELDTVAGTPCVHAYGHGGIGVTVSWGVAEHVAQLVPG